MSCSKMFQVVGGSLNGSKTTDCDRADQLLGRTWQWWQLMPQPFQTTVLALASMKVSTSHRRDNDTDLVFPICRRGGLTSHNNMNQSATGFTLPTCCLTIFNIIPKPCKCPSGSTVLLGTCHPGVKNILYLCSLAQCFAWSKVKAKSKSNRIITIHYNTTLHI